MYVVKLAVMLVLVGGVAKYDKSGMKMRGDGHLLLVGDPGMPMECGLFALST
jgi:DNA helicase MCM9